MPLRILAAVLIVLGLLGVGADAGPKQKEEIVFWFGATQDERAAYEQMIAEFNRTHPHIVVYPMLVPQSYVERKLILSIAGGAPPDVVRFYAHLGGEMMSRGGLEPLDGLVARDDFDLSHFYPVTIEQNTYQGKLYGIPWVVSPTAFFYNKKLFREAGLDPERPPRTWKEVEDYAMRLTVRAPDGGIERVGYANFLDNPANFHLYLWQNGGEPLSQDMKTVTFDQSIGVETLTWMRDFLIKEVGSATKGLTAEEAADRAFSNLQKFSSTYRGAAQDPFGLEKVAMRIDTPFRIPDLKKYFPDLEYGIAPVPHSKIQALEVVGNSLVIPRGSKHKEAAWEFIKFASQFEQSVKVCEVAGRVPARFGDPSDPVWNAYYNSLDVKPFVDQIKHGRTTPIAPGYREVSDVLARAIDSSFRGQLSPEAALKQAAVKGQEILDEANQDLDRLPMIPWVTVAIVVGAVCILAATVGVRYFLRHTKGSKTARREALTFYLFLSPWFVGFIILTFGSIVASLVFSFARWDMLSPARFVGISNYTQLITDDPRFINALANTLYYAFFTVPLSITGGLAISVLLNQKLRAIRAFRTIYYLPVVVSGVATAILWQSLFSPGPGLFNRLLTSTGIAKLLAMRGMDITKGFLNDPGLAKPAFIIMTLWTVGGAMIIYLAGLQGIPEELYEAARIDGASAWQRFRNVTLPLLTPTIFYQFIVGTMAALQFFTPAYIMTGGGPQDATMFYSLYLFKNSFEWMKMGLASAMAWMLFVIVFAITYTQFKMADRWVYYEGSSEK